MGSTALSNRKMQIILILIGLLTCSAKDAGTRQQALDSEQRNSLRAQKKIHFHQSHVGGKAGGQKTKLVACKVVDDLKKKLDSLDEGEITKYLSKEKIQRNESPYCEWPDYRGYTYWSTLNGEKVSDDVCATACS